MSFARRYCHLLESGNLSEINALPVTTRPDVIKALIIIAKFTGSYEPFKAALKSYGIKMSKPDALAGFLRIYNNNNADLGEWIARVKPIFKPEENLLLQFLKLTGLRKQEAITSFNMIIDLNARNKLGDYLHDGILEHFRYKAFLRGTKNAYISIVPESLIAQIIQSKPVSYYGLIKRLERRSIPCRISELRDQFGTFLVQHGLIREEVDLLQGRVSASIFTRHYFSPAIRELRDRTLKALSEMDVAK
jgi:hypothetical protein